MFLPNVPGATFIPGAMFIPEYLIGSECGKKHSIKKSLLEFTKNDVKYNSTKHCPGVPPKSHPLITTDSL